MTVNLNSLESMHHAKLEDLIKAMLKDFNNRLTMIPEEHRFPCLVFALADDNSVQVWAEHRDGQDPNTILELPGLRKCITSTAVIDIKEALILVAEQIQRYLAPKYVKNIADEYITVQGQLYRKVVNQ